MKDEQTLYIIFLKCLLYNKIILTIPFIVEAITKDVKLSGIMNVTKHPPRE
jgi:hypothetical protein